MANSQVEILAFLVHRLAELAKVEEAAVDVTAPFTSYGLDSLDAVIMAQDLEDWLGFEVSPTLVWDYPHPQALAHYLATGEDMRAASSRSGPAAGADEPVAIIGMGCRLPGGVNGPAQFWRLLLDSADAITAGPEPWRQAHSGTHYGGFVDGVDQFDPAFFGISAREAVQMDPQQRLLLEVAWEALEDAGQSRERLARSATGVFVGISGQDYGRLAAADPDPYTPTGNAFSIAANRLSYLLDLTGPSMAVDTACSSSLVAVHLACQALRGGECDLALAGGVNLLLDSDVTQCFADAGFMAPDGRCKSFDARADGYVRGEGAGLVVLKRLPDALAAGDPIYAVILASAVNQDGRTNGLTAPNRQSQEAILQEAYRRAKINPGDVQYIEAHGTGTALGDPIEAAALGRVLSMGRPYGERCLLGSVKSNIGHLESAAGAAGLMKVALSLHHGQIPPSLHFLNPSPHIPFADLPLQVVTQVTPWPAAGRRLAGLSSFGFGGTNCHLVLTGAPPLEARTTASSPDAGLTLLPLSAHSPAALQAMAARWADWLETAGANWHDVSYTASARRTHLGARLAVVAGSAADTAAQLRALAEAGAPVRPTARGKLAFVFTGQGAQWVGMGRELLAAEPAFRAQFEECDRLFRRYVDWSLIDELLADAERSRLSETAVAQPCLFAMQVALVALWRSLGLEPEGVAGHSLGEITAACVAGALSLPDAVTVVYHRSRLMQRLTGLGQMVAVDLPEAALSAWLRPDGAEIAALNSPESTVVAGAPDQVAEISERLTAEGRRVVRLPVNYAFHSRQADALLPELTESLQALRSRPMQIPFYSTVTGEQVQGRLGADHWAQNIRQPVRFAPAIAQMLANGYDQFVEVGPHPALLHYLREIAQDRQPEPLLLHSLRRGQPERAELLATLGALYCAGRSVAWEHLYPDAGQVVPLPAYPWQHKRYWVEASAAPGRRTRAGAGARTPGLPGRHFQPAESPGTHYFELELEPETDRVEFPFWLELALAGLAEVAGAAPVAMRSVEFPAPLALHGERHIVQLCLSELAGPDWSFRISSRPAGAPRLEPYTLHAAGLLSLEAAESLPVLIEELTARCHDRLALPGGRTALTGRSEAMASGGFDLLPELLSIAADTAADAGGGGRCEPERIEAVRVAGRPPAEAWLHVRVPSGSAELGEAGALVADESGAVLVAITGLSFRRVKAEAPARTRVLDGGQAAVEQYLAEQVARSLGVPVAAIDRKRPLQTLILESIMAIELKHRVEKELGLSVPISSLLGNVGIADLAAHLLTLHTPAPPASAPADARQSAEALLERLDELSDTEMQELLAQMSGSGGGAP